MCQDKLRRSVCSQRSGIGPLRVQTVLTWSLFVGRVHGVRGLYLGLRSKLTQMILTAALMFVCYEKISDLVFTVMLLEPSNAHAHAHKTL